MPKHDLYNKIIEEVGTSRLLVEAAWMTTGSLDENEANAIAALLQLVSDRLKGSLTDLQVLEPQVTA